jgi:hypothetical protein
MVEVELVDEEEVTRRIAAAEMVTLAQVVAALAT